MPRDGGQGSCVSGGPHGPTNATCGRWINEPSECYYANGIPRGKIQLILWIGFLSGAVFACIIAWAESCLSSNSFRGLLEIIDGISLVLCVRIISTIQFDYVFIGVAYEFFFFGWQFIARRYGTGPRSFTGDHLGGFLTFILVLGFHIGLVVEDAARRGDSVFALACFFVFSGYLQGTAKRIVNRWNKDTVPRLVQEAENVEDS